MAGRTLVDMRHHHAYLIWSSRFPFTASRPLNRPKGLLFRALHVFHGPITFNTITLTRLAAPRFLFTASRSSLWPSCGTITLTRFGVPYFHLQVLAISQSMRLALSGASRVWHHHTRPTCSSKVSVYGIPPLSRPMRDLALSGTSYTILADMWHRHTYLLLEFLIAITPFTTPGIPSSTKVYSFWLCIRTNPHGKSHIVFVHLSSA